MVQNGALSSNPPSTHMGKKQAKVGGGEEKDFAKPALGIMYGDGNNSYDQGFEDCALVFSSSTFAIHINLRAPLVPLSSETGCIQML